MKRIFLAASLLIAAASVTNVLQANASVATVSFKDGDDDGGGGKHISPSQVPAPVIASFNAKFPAAMNAQWEKESEHGGTTYKVDFYQNGKRWRAVFAPNGTVLSSGRH